ncbi:MAG TPA: cytochrome c biogenesis protein CcdA [Actinotalea sp.]|nr:cytochrome c biogenesis protein CcdA [Actinotalea sp.]
MPPELWSAITLAVSAGAIAAFNPCGVALLPTYLALFLGERSTTRSGAARALAVGASMTAGFVLVFGVAGLAVTGLSLALGPWLSLVTIGSGVVLVVVGLVLLAGRDPSLRIPRARLRVDGTPRGMAAYGVVYATVSLSCTLPVFVAAVVSTFTISGGSAAAGVLALLAYALGMGAVMAVLALVAAVFGAGAARRAGAMMRHLPRVSGAFVLVAGAYVLWYGWVEHRAFRGETGGTGPVAWVAAASAAVGNTVADLGAVRLVVVALVVVAVAGVVSMVRRRTRRAAAVAERSGTP